MYYTTRPSPSTEPEVYNLRNCECADDWKAKKGESVCTCGGSACAAKVDPRFLTEAIGQDVCSLRRHTGYLCTVGCKGEEVFWYGKSCGSAAGMEPCAPLVASPTATPTSSKTSRPPIVVPQASGGRRRQAARPLARGAGPPPTGCLPSGLGGARLLPAR